MVLFTLLTIVTVKSVLSDVNCIDVKGARSGKGDDNLSTATCPGGYTITSCGTESYWKNLDGSYISGNTCFARNGAGGNGVYARARCCAFGDTIDSCRSEHSYKSGTHDDAHTKVSCYYDDAIMFGCTVNTFWTDIDGSCPGNQPCYKNPGFHNPLKYYNHGNVCSAMNGSGGNGVYAEAQCCRPKKGYNYECKQIWGTKSGAKDDDRSVVKCDSDYFLAGCSGFTLWNEMDGWWIQDDKCIAQNGSGGNGVWAIANCCKQV